MQEEAFRLAKAKKLPSGNWRCRVPDHTINDGKAHYKSFTAPTKKEAELLALKYSTSQTEIKYCNFTLHQAYERYINSKSAVLSPSTIAGYNRSMRNHFQSLMNYSISKITAEMVQNAVNEMCVTHSPKTVHNAHGLLHAVFKTYRPELELKTTLPQKVKPEYIIPTTEEVNKLLFVANDIIRVPILLASQASLRRSEICALTKADFTPFGVQINKAAVYDENGSIIIKPPKTKAGNRFVPLNKNVIDECMQWQYFNLPPDDLTYQFYSCLAKANIPRFSFHKLRHYFASELHAQGIPDQYIIELGGWESVEMLHNIYQHTMRDKQKEVTNKVINIFNANFSKNDTKNDTKNKKVTI